MILSGLRASERDRSLRRAGAAVMSLVVIGLLAGCLPGKRPAEPEVAYTLEYAPPSPPAAAGGGAAAGGPGVQAGLVVSPFTAAPGFGSTAMIYSPEEYERQTYNYSNWSARPGDLVSSYLLRDFSIGGLFPVFSSQEYSGARFLLDGRVDEFLEIDGPGGPEAAVTVTITLLDKAQTDITRQVVLQKRFRARAAMDGRTPLALARGMSTAMRELSKQIQESVAGALRARISERT